MSKKDLVEAAVAFCLDARREEMQAGMRELLSKLAGSPASRVAMLAGMTRRSWSRSAGPTRTTERGQAGPAHARTPMVALEREHGRRVARRQVAADRVAKLWTVVEAHAVQERDADR
jgi:hypothetical protein